MCRFSNAPRRALLVLIGALALGLLMGSTANADDGATPPRAVPAARSMPRAFSSYDDLISYATALAVDQSALDRRLTDTHAKLDSSLSELIAVTPAGGRGGGLFGIEGDRRTRSQSTLTIQVVRLIKDQQQLVAAGALTAPPVAWRMPTAGEITQPFGPTDVRVEPSRTHEGVTYRHFHDGVDIAGPWRADVVAPARGRVAFVGRMLDGAEVVVLVHDSGIVTLYAHLDAWSSPPPVRAGDEVAAGQKIGTVGMTGITLGMHLHWAAYRGGQVIDPMTLIGR